MTILTFQEHPEEGGLESEESVLDHIISTHKLELKDIEQDNDQFEENENKEDRKKACNDADCLRIGKDKCLCYYEKESDNIEG